MPGRSPTARVPHPFGRLEAVAAGRPGIALMAVWGFAEAVVFPVIPDVGLLLLALVVPRRAGRLFAAVMAGAIAGTAVLFAAAVVAPDRVAAMLLALPAIDQPMLDAASAAVAAGDPSSMALVGPGTPLKVYTYAWATGPASPVPLALGVVLNRITRVGPGLVLVVLLGLRAPAFLRRHDRLVLGTYVALWVVGYAAYWS